MPPVQAWSKISCNPSVKQRLSILLTGHEKEVSAANCFCKIGAEALCHGLGCEN